ncbi:MAG: ribulose-phosphate 3-epimerase [Candidatus Flexifilum sp.]
MTSPVLIAPSILAADFTRLGEQIRDAEAAGADWFHIDIMDGHFVPNISMGPLVVEACRRATSRPLDVHLMIEAPERFLTDFVNAGADRITVHVETCPHLHRVLSAIRELNVGVGVALNPHTPVVMIEAILDLVDLVLVMTVNPGFGGQSFIPAALSKIQLLHRYAQERDLKYRIEVDGGINTQTAPLVVNAGARVLVAGSSVFNGAQGIQASIQALRESIAAR